jgi:hypothetical protein
MWVLALFEKGSAQTQTYGKRMGGTSAHPQHMYSFDTITAGAPFDSGAGHRSPLAMFLVLSLSSQKYRHKTRHTGGEEHAHLPSVRRIKLGNIQAEAPFDSGTGHNIFIALSFYLIFLKIGQMSSKRGIREGFPRPVVPVRIRDTRRQLKHLSRSSRSIWGQHPNLLIGLLSSPRNGRVNIECSR